MNYYNEIKKVITIKVRNIEKFRIIKWNYNILTIMRIVYNLIRKFMVVD